MRFRILGPLEVRSADGEPVAVGGPRQRALLALLLLDAGRLVGVDSLISAQYGDNPPANAGNAVQAQVSRLRRSLAGLLEFHSGAYRLAVNPDDVDAHRFERLAGEGHRLLAGGDHRRAADVLREALGLWRGAALADLPDHDSLVARLDDLRLAAAEDLVEAELALAEGTSVTDLRALVADNPLRERLRGQLMRALAAAGRQAEALTEFEDLRRLLADELGTDPSPELSAVHLELLRAEPTRPSRRRVAGALTSFVGRDSELDRLAELRDARLVTILGPGGTGKTRLATEFARRGQRSACFVDLAGVDGQVAQAVLGALGIRESGFHLAAADPVGRLLGALRDSDLLLILDNCEHVVDAVAGLAHTLLTECPGLSVLATSREPLGITGERLFPLTPLDVTDAAVRLFADRAAAVRPGFTVTDDNHATVVDICASLDGLPLAIELAAARLRQFGVGELAARLAEHGRFRLLSRGDRTAAARHRTLRAAVEWSWELLKPDEQVLARRFSVFAGGAPLNAVTAVCDVLDADDLLADLVDKSLVEADGTRYRMLETIRLFCAEQLAAADEETTLRRAHARYHLALARRAEPHLRRAEQLDWLAVLAAEHANLSAAVRWAVTHEPPTGYQLVAALAAYWWLGGRGGDAGPAAAALLGQDAPDGLAEEYVSCVVHAEPRAAAEHWERATRIVRELRGPLRYPFGLALWGMTAGPPPDDADPTVLLAGDSWTAALNGLGTGLIALLTGRTADGDRELSAVLDEFRALGERWGTAQALDGLAQSAAWRGEWQRARDLWAEALALHEQLGALDECADLLTHRAPALMSQGDLAGAEADLRRAAELSARTGQPGVPPVVELGLGDLARFRGDPAEARERLDRALAGSRDDDFTSVSVRSRVLTALGRLADATGSPDVELHRQAVATARMPAYLAHAVEGLAGSVPGEEAALLLGVAVALRGTAVAGDPDVAATAARARDELGADAFAAGYARGAGMSREQALTVVDETTGRLSADRR